MLYTYEYIQTYIGLHINIYIYAYTYMYIYIRTCIHTYMHTCIHTPTGRAALVCILHDTSFITLTLPQTENALNDVITKSSSTSKYHIFSDFDRLNTA